MKRLYLPVKFRNHGLHIWCNACKKTVTQGPCKHYEKQRFQSRVYNPVTKAQDCIQSYETRDAEQAFSLHLDYKAELKQNNYNIVQVASSDDAATPSPMVFLKAAASKYSDFLQDVDVPPQEQKKLSAGYIRDQARYLTHFLEIVQKKEKKITNFPVEAVTPSHVTDLHVWLKNKELTQTTYNAYMKACKYFFVWVIKNLKVTMRNPFEDVKMPEVHYDPEIIPIEEFEQLLSMIKPENGFGVKRREETRKCELLSSVAQKGICPGAADRRAPRRDCTPEMDAY